MTIVGSFINALFNFLLGWIRGTAQWLWNMVTSDSHGGLLGWAMRNWLPLVILLCIFGVVMDFLVYLIRWQPYRVWGNFWTRFLPKRARRTPTGRHLIYADGTMIEEEQVVQHKPKPAPKREGHRSDAPQAGDSCPARTFRHNADGTDPAAADNCAGQKSIS